METQVKQYKLGGETMYTGTIQSQVSLQMLDLKWQKKKQDINSKKDTEGMTQDEILLDSLERQAQTERERSATSELYTKLKTGGTLTEEEIAYLKEHDPEALAEYEKAQTEKKAYENALKNCRTKEDVQRLKLNRMGSFAAQAKEIASNPYIPKDKKVVLMQRLNNEVCMIRDAHQAFEKSRAYERSFRRNKSCAGRQQRNLQRKRSIKRIQSRQKRQKIQKSTIKIRQMQMQRLRKWMNRNLM